MQVVNRKERSNAKWRFAGLYLMSLTIPALLIFNSIDMGKVESKDTSQLVEQLRKRDQALAELSQLAITLNTMQQLKPAFERFPEPGNKTKYEQLKYDFETGVNKLKQLYFSDTTLYNSNYKIAEALEYNYGEYNEMPDELDTAIQNATNKIAGNKVPPSGGNGNQAEVLTLQFKLEKAQSKIEVLEEKLKSQPDPDSRDIEELRNRAHAMDTNINGINVLLDEVKVDADKIQKKGDSNLDAKKKILEKVANLKSHTASIKNSNNILISSLN